MSRAPKTLTAEVSFTERPVRARYGRFSFAATPRFRSMQSSVTLLRIRTSLRCVSVARRRDDGATAPKAMLLAREALNNARSAVTEGSKYRTDA